MKKFHYLCLAILLVATSVLAGSNNLPIESPGVIQLQHVNKFQTALTGDLVPRNTLGNPGDTVGDLGTTTYRWRSLFTKSISLQENANGNATIITSPSGIPQPINLRLLNQLPLAESNLTVNALGQIGLGAPKAGTILATASSNGFNTIFPTTDVAITNLSGTLVTFGRPVVLYLDTTTGGYISGANGQIGGSAIQSDGGHFAFKFLMDGVDQAYLPTGSVNPSNQPCSAISTFLPSVPAGSHTFSVKVSQIDAGVSNGVYVSFCRLVAYEI